MNILQKLIKILIQLIVNKYLYISLVKFTIMYNDDIDNDLPIDVGIRPQLDPKKYKNIIKNGTCNSNWISNYDYNLGEFIWKKIKTMNDCNTADEYYKQSIKERQKIVFDTINFSKKIKLIRDELLQHNIFLYELKWSDCYNDQNNLWPIANKYLLGEKILEEIEINDDNYSYISSDKHNSNIIIHPVSILFFSNYMLYNSTKKGKMSIIHKILEKDMKIVFDIFITHFKDKFSCDFNKRPSEIIIDMDPKIFSKNILFIKNVLKGKI